MRPAIKPTKFEIAVFKTNWFLWIIFYSTPKILWITWENSRKPWQLGILSVDNHVESVDLSPV